MSGLIPWLLFLGLASLTASMAAGMLVTMSMYRAGLALMASFVALAGLFLLLNADLLAAIQVMMNVGGMLIMILFMVMLMIDPGGEMMWDMKRKMGLPGPGAFSMSMPRAEPAPAAHAGPASTDPSPPAPAASWTCPMHPEIRERQAGACPICGMDLVPMAATADPPAEEHAGYTCPMHPEIRADRPGQCPLCGMDLVPVTATAATGHALHAPLYTCPMHPEVRQPAPGNCPQCGMTLVPAGDAPAPVAAPRAGAPAHPAGPEGPAPGAAMGSRESHSAPLSPDQHYQMMAGMAMSTVQLPWALAVGAACAAVLGLLILRTPWPTSPGAPAADATSAVGQLLLSRYMIAFEGAAFLIVAGIVGAVVFATRERPAHPVPVPGAAPRATEPAAAPVPEPAAASYTCPMHPQVRQAYPGQCPLCGMDLVPAGAAAPAEPQPVGPPAQGGRR